MRPQPWLAAACTTPAPVSACWSQNACWHRVAVRRLAGAPGGYSCCADQHSFFTMRRLHCSWHTRTGSTCLNKLAWIIEGRSAEQGRPSSACVPSKKPGAWGVYPTYRRGASPLLSDTKSWFGQEHLPPVFQQLLALKCVEHTNATHQNNVGLVCNSSVLRDTGQQGALFLFEDVCSK